MREFAESEIILPPGGPFNGERFRCRRQPYAGLWFDAIDSGRWNRFVATGPVQSGKTLSAFIVPMMYHLFEVQETVICGLPTLEMASDKWHNDIFPVIETSRFRHLLPRQGAGSRGGKVDRIRFGNGATLKFMSGGGGDKQRAHFTSRVLVVTETDGMDESASTSREADKITQMEARTAAFGDRRRIYLECTVSTEQGRTWREYTKGTQSRIVLRCPHCKGHCTPEREDLSGWESAENEMEAKARAAFFCKACGEAWSEDDRKTAHEGAMLVHRGQEIDPEGNIVGPLPPTETLGFRWSAVNNLFVTAGMIGQEEWLAKRSHDEENQEKRMRQFRWALPHIPPTWQTASLDVEAILKRTKPIPRGVVPAESKWLTLGIDIGQWLAHWTLIGWTHGATGHVVDYGRFELATDQLGVERAIVIGLRNFRDSVEHGWPQGDAFMKPDLVLIDAGFQGESVNEFCLESGKRYMPSLGRGMGQQVSRRYAEPKSTGAIVQMVGRDYHVSTIPGSRGWRIEVNADAWKSWLHQRLTTPIGKDGSLSLFDVGRNEHLSYAKHLTAERQVQEFIAEKGQVTRWECIRRDNHWLDSTALACVAGHAVGVRLQGESEPVQDEPLYIHPGASRPDGRNWIPN